MLRTSPLPATHVRAGTDLRTLARSYAAIIVGPPISALTRAVRPRVAARKSRPSVRCTIRVLASLNARPLGASHAASHALTCSACCLVWQQATRRVGVPGHRRAAGYDIVGVDTASIAHPGGLLQPMQGDVQDQRTDHTALRHALRGGREPHPGLDHPGLQPAGGHPSRREHPQRREKTIMIDGVERAGQVRVENPHPCAATGQGVEQRLDRVVTAAARPKPDERASKRASHSGSSAWRTRAWWHRSMITGMPSGLFLVLSWAFGIYTRLTATGRHELRVACTCTATSARARAVNATRPSIPAVARPALRCVTCRTLISVFDQFRSMSFCRFRAFARSPSRTALKILRRSRRTRSSCIRQSTCCQASASTTPGGSSGPFTEVSNVPFGSDIHVRFVVKGSPAHVSTHPRFQAPGPVSGRLSNHHPGEGPGHAVVGFPLSFDHRHSLLGHLSRREFRPDHSRPTSTAHAYLRTRCGPRRGFTTFHTRETRTGPGALFTPRMTVFAGHRVVRSRRLPPP